MKMSSLSRVGVGLSVVFTCLLLALIAEIYYLLWWKRRIINREIKDNDYRNPSKEFFYMFCWKKQSKSSLDGNSTGIPNTQIHESSNQEFQFHSQNNKDDYKIDFMTGPPRFLFTIKEETKEELESEDGKSRRGKRSLNDLLKNVESSNNNTPFLTPVSSPPFVTPPITPMGSCHSSQSGYNPFLECSTDAEFNKIVKSSPPPKFQFLIDAEAKLQRKIMLMEEAKKEAILQKFAEENGSFIRIIVAKNKGNDKSNHHYHSPHCHSADSSSSFSSQV